MEGDRGPWIAWPSRKPQDSGTWVKQVIITNKALRDAIEKTLLKKYQDIRKESGSSSGGEPEY
jgi:DNA-binding cell septation regulator SpoVG